MKLFQPPPTRPRWTELPSEVRQQTLALLARLLRPHRRSILVERQPPEVRDE
jgi:hypothetical protein